MIPLTKQPNENIMYVFLKRVQELWYTLYQWGTDIHQDSNDTFSITNKTTETLKEFWFSVHKASAGAMVSWTSVIVAQEKYFLQNNEDSNKKNNNRWSLYDFPHPPDHC